MAEIKIDENLDIIKRKLSAVSRDKWPQILSEAATETAFHVRNRLRRDMPNYIDRPKPYTINSLFAKKATPSRLEASVQWRNEGQAKSGGRYLKPNVQGGSRPQKKFEQRLEAAGLMPSGYLAVPTKDIPKDAYGNVTANTLIKILRGLKLLPSNDKGTKSKVKGSSQRAQKLFAVVEKRGRLSPGIYERVTLFGSSAVRRLFSYVNKATYSKIFPFYDLGTKYANEKFPSHLDETIKKNIQSSQ